MGELRGKIKGADERQAALLLAQKAFRNRLNEGEKMVEELKRGGKEREEAWRKREESWKERERAWREREEVWGEGRWRGEVTQWEMKERGWKEREEGLKEELREALKVSECRRIESSLLTESVKSLQVQLEEVEKLVDIQGGLERERERRNVMGDRKGRKEEGEGDKNGVENSASGDYEQKNVSINAKSPATSTNTENNNTNNTNNNNHHNSNNNDFLIDEKEEAPLDLKEMKLRLAALNEDGLLIQVFSPSLLPFPIPLSLCIPLYPKK